MALKNTYSEMPMHRIMDKINKVLVDHGASKILIEYDDSKMPFQISFMVTYAGRDVPIRLPAKVHKVWEYMKKQRTRSNPPIDTAYRVAWRNILDWIEAQMALIEIEQAEMFEVFMPYLAMKDGGTLYDSQKDKILGLPFNE